MERIIIATDAWHPQVNGVVTALSRVAERLMAQGVLVTVIHPGLFRTLPMPRYPEIRLAILPYKKVVKILEEVKPDAIHIATEGPIGFAMRRAATRRGLPFTTSYHTHYHLYLDKHLPGLAPLTNRFLRSFHRPAIRTLVATPSLKSALEAEGFGHISLWPLGVDAKRFTRISGAPQTDFTKPVFAFFGRVAREKNIEAFLMLDLPGTKLVIGDGPDRHKLEKKYPHATFVGYKHGENLVETLSTVDVLVFPSKTDTFGLVVLEALACGIPVAAYDVMGPRDIITQGVDGYVGDDLKASALAALQLDPSVCRHKALQYPWERSTEAFIDALAPIPPRVY